MEWSNASPFTRPVEVTKGTADYIDAIDISPTYSPPGECLLKPSEYLNFLIRQANDLTGACFYIRLFDEQDGD
jgi:hypothetical protein